VHPNAAAKKQTNKVVPVNEGDPEKDKDGPEK
jgi:hypothetical protein